MLRNTQPQQLDAAQSLSKSDSKSIVLKSPTSALPRQLCWTAHKMVHSETRQRSLAMWPKLPSWQRGKTHWTKKSRKLWPLPWMLKTNTKTTSLLLFSCTQTWWNLCERGGTIEQTKIWKIEGEKVQGKWVHTYDLSWSHLPKWSPGWGWEECGSGRCRGPERKKTVSVSCQSNGNGRTDTSLLCHALQQE